MKVKGPLHKIGSKVHVCTRYVMDSWDSDRLGTIIDTRLEYSEHIYKIDRGEDFETNWYSENEVYNEVYKEGTTSYMGTTAW